MRQWVLSLPLRLRYRLAWDLDLCRAAMGRALRALHGLLRRRAHDGGIREALGALEQPRAGTLDSPSTSLRRHQVHRVTF